MLVVVCLAVTANQADTDGQLNLQAVSVGPTQCVGNLFLLALFLRSSG